MSLESLVAELPGATQDTVTIDISDLFDKEAGVITLDFREPTLPEVFRVADLTKKIKIQRPFWPEELCNTVALIAACYVKGETEKQHSFISMTTLAERMGLKFMTLSQRFTEKFPHLQDMAKAGEEAKKE